MRGIIKKGTNEKKKGEKMVKQQKQEVCDRQENEEDGEDLDDEVEDERWE